MNYQIINFVIAIIVIIILVFLFYYGFSNDPPTIRIIKGFASIITAK